MSLFAYRIHKGVEVDEIIDIPDVMFNAGRLRQRHFYDEILLTLTRQSLQEVDSIVSQGVSIHQNSTVNALYFNFNAFSFDLYS